MTASDRALMTLGAGVRFSPDVCQGWVYLQLIFMELLTFVVEAILVVRRESFLSNRDRTTKPTHRSICFV